MTGGPSSSYHRSVGRGKGHRKNKKLPFKWRVVGDCSCCSSPLLALESWKWRRPSWRDSARKGKQKLRMHLRNGLIVKKTWDRPYTLLFTIFHCRMKKKSDKFSTTNYITKCKLSRTTGGDDSSSFSASLLIYFPLPSNGGGGGGESCRDVVFDSRAEEGVIGDPYKDMCREVFFCFGEFGSFNQMRYLSIIGRRRTCCEVLRCETKVIWKTHEKVQMHIKKIFCSFTAPFTPRPRNRE